ncbi:syntaxin ufe1 [Yamadazyma tenuis]|uniref:t-SNARE coiled-coil homology domain-containing protein n=1 Tax=Candida tenuis (strain ATCC 10573 / BCRC 21748 / CBS 615 / JCM 9827 / NBRC 10315 / NRRL Y-1498 / VKM Y-70) TaxID=590646 RepID=G3BF59_CANTC|nr:uncharacterized protein CANTEDRAFT_100014 [Yamadazyma tenuis ATCC 10573]EGV60646.1 hypothetical protein CANTEDRAFT_100014 [Yamadazyma tenuis ATCC 10573]WEJ94104.1 syntaxin ufe1 [Yamadazyma tenuis]
MADLTPLFNQVVSIVQEEFRDSIQINRLNKDEYAINDTFTKESKGLYRYIIGLNSFLEQIKQPYLAINDDNDTKGLSIDDKNKLDEDFQIKLQALYEKLKVLQNYEKKRQVHKPKGHWISNMFGDEEEDMKQLYFVSLSNHRNQVLKFLSESLNNSGKQFQKLQKKRIQRERQLNLLNFQNLEDDLDLDIPATELDGPISWENEVPQLSPGQIQEFESENETLLSLKNTQLKKVETLHTSMVDIMNMQAEITYQIESQSSQIMNLIDNQDQINFDLTSGNKNLTKATSRNKKSANIIITTNIILGILLLIMDYIR